MIEETNEMPPQEAADKEASGGRRPSPCWGLAVNMEKSENLGYATQVTKRLMLGYMFAKTEDEAVGTFMRRCYKECPGFKADSPVTIRLPNVPSVPPERSAPDA